MPKPIKFRAWDAVEECMVDSTTKLWRGWIRWHSDGTLQGHCDINIMQFTGRLDKFGKEIYEGDIVEWRYPDDWCAEPGDTEKHPNAGQLMWTWVIEWNEEDAAYNWPDPWLEPAIVGNKYQNPELVKD